MKTSASKKQKQEPSKGQSKIEDKKGKANDSTIKYDFKRPEERIDFQLIGQCYISKQWISKNQKTDYFRQVHHFIFLNSKLYIREKTIAKDGNPKQHNYFEYEKLVKFVNFDSVTASVSLCDRGLLISFSGISQTIYVEPILNERDAKSKQQTQLTSKIFQTKKLSFQWVNLIIQNVCKKSKGYKILLNYLTPNNASIFLEFQNAFDTQFQQKANTGDIILFSNKGGAQIKKEEPAKKQFFQSFLSAVNKIKQFTQIYNHIGIVIRNNNNKLEIFEYKDKKVTRNEWNFKYYAQQYKYGRICWRKLNVNFSKQKLYLIENFIKKGDAKIEQIKSKFGSKQCYCSNLIQKLYKQQLKLTYSISIPFAQNDVTPDYFSYPINFDYTDDNQKKYGWVLSQQILLLFDNKQ